MPDAAGNFKGIGWSQKRSDAYDRIFPRMAENAEALARLSDVAPYDPWRPTKDVPDLMAALEASLGIVPGRPSSEIPPDCNGCGQDGHVLDDCPAHPER